MGGMRNYTARRDKESYTQGEVSCVVCWCGHALSANTATDSVGVAYVGETWYRLSASLPC